MKTRPEKEMLELIHQYIESDDRIRVAVMNGSRANPNIEKDIFQDYDIACYVTDVKPFLVEKEVVPYFGEALIVEQPNYGPWPPDDADGSYHNYNMQFVDGNRIDLTFFSIDKLEEACKDSLSLVLVDKDELCSNWPVPNESSYFISEPTEKTFNGCCDAFLFAMGSHIPKTIWRKQLPLLKSYTEGWLRVPVRLMLFWEIGVKNGFDKNVGVSGRYFEKYLDSEKWYQYLNTYADSDYENIWHSLFEFFTLFTESALFIADEYGYTFPKKKAENVLSFLKHVRDLPDNAESIYS